MFRTKKQFLGLQATTARLLGCLEKIMYGAWPKLWHKNGVFDQILGCSGHFDVTLENWAPVVLKTFYKNASYPQTLPIFVQTKA